MNIKSVIIVAGVLIVVGFVSMAFGESSLVNCSGAWTNPQYTNDCLTLLYNQNLVILKNQGTLILEQNQTSKLLAYDYCIKLWSYKGGFGESFDNYLDSCVNDMMVKTK